MTNRPIKKVLFLLTVSAVLWAARADARVAVAFQHPETYGDIDLRDAQVLPAIRAHLERLGERYLGRDAVLRITVIDVRIAGRYAPPHSVTGPRVMSDGTWPLITLRYTLTRGGRVVASGEETISDQFYLSRSRTVSSGPLAYEKALLDDWFRERFASR